MTLSLLAAPFWDDTHTERVESTGAYFHSYQFTMPGNHPSAEFAVPKGLVVFPDLDGNTKCFVIKTVDDESSTGYINKRVYAEDSAQDDLGVDIIEPVTYSQENCETLLTNVLAGTRWSVGVVEGDSTELVDIEWLEYQTAWECVLWLSERFDLEVQTRVDVLGAHITNRYIDLLEQRGTYTGQVLQYSRDTTAVTRSGDGGEVFTAMYGLGASDALGYIDFSSIEWTTGDGDPVDKPNGQLWVGLETARYGDPNADPPVPAYGISKSDGTIIHRFGVYRNPDETNAAALLQQTYDELVKKSRPQFNYTVAVAALERMPAQRPGDLARSWETLRIGDTVVVRDTAVYPPYQSDVRVIEVQRSYSDPTRDSVMLGEPVKRVSEWFADAVRLKRRVSRKEGAW